MNRSLLCDCRSKPNNPPPRNLWELTQRASEVFASLYIPLFDTFHLGWSSTPMLSKESLLCIMTRLSEHASCQLHLFSFNTLDTLASKLLPYGCNCQTIDEYFAQNRYKRRFEIINLIIGHYHDIPWCNTSLNHFIKHLTGKTHKQHLNTQF